MIRRGCYQPKRQLLGGVRTRKENAPFHGARNNRGLRRPFLRRPGANQHPGHGCAIHASIILARKPQVHRSPARVIRSSHAEQWIPQPFAERLETCVGHDLLVEPQITAWGPVLRQPEAFVAIQASLGCTHADKRAPIPFMNPVAPRHFDKHERLSVTFPVMNVDSQGGLHRVRADLDKQAVNCRLCSGDIP